MNLKTFVLILVLFIASSCKENADTAANSTGGSSGGLNGSTGNPITTTNANGTAPSGGHTYVIKKGNHYHTGLDGAWGSRKHFGRQAYFFADAAYESVIPVNQLDINKLIGFSDCGAVFSNHNNSARFGWNWDPTTQMIKLHAYTYVNSERQWAYIKSIPLKTTVTLNLSVEGYFYTFQADQVTVKMPRHCDSKWAWGWQLFPYFGGDETAPHDIHIWLKEI